MQKANIEGRLVENHHGHSYDSFAPVHGFGVKKPHPNRLVHSNMLVHSSPFAPTRTAVQPTQTTDIVLAPNSNPDKSSFNPFSSSSSLLWLQVLEGP